MGDPLFGAKVVTVRQEEEFREAFRRGLEGKEPSIISKFVDGKKVGMFSDLRVPEEKSACLPS